MIFSSLAFCIFFALVLLGLVLLRTNFARKTMLLIASWYFYAYWDWRFLSLIWISTVVDYFVGDALGREKNKSVRRFLLGFSLFVNLGLLFFFKYFNFFIESMSTILERIGLHSGTLDIILPVGISFYTFQTLSYTIDVYRGRLKPQESLLDFSLFVCFFPQLVAGPIVRASNFLPQLRTYKPISWANVYTGGQLFVYGLFKKVFLADRLAMFPDHVFSNAGAYDCLTTWMAAGAYSLQIYFDFSGYSDMAIGIARIMGYTLEPNFHFPYLSKSPQEFWRRWHISLSSWIRDYLYIPLGGNRKGRGRTYVNVFISMSLCGLWHGAAWTFVTWGVLHGVALILNRVWVEKVGTRTNGKALSVVAWAGTMMFVVIGWVLFRSESFGKAELMFRQMFVPEPGLRWFFPFFLFALTGSVIMHVLEVNRCFERLLLPVSTRWYSPALLCSLVWLVFLFYPSDFAPFIYFQF